MIYGGELYVSAQSFAKFLERIAIKLFFVVHG
jgi:hypothetical protein